MGFTEFGELSKKMYEKSNVVIYKRPEEKPEELIVNVYGIIEKAEFEIGNCFSAHYQITYGNDWSLINGQLSGDSHQACQGENQSNFFVWNFPFEFALKTKDPTGWPQIAISITGPDFLGRDIIKAYSICRIPTTSGPHVRTLQAFSPLSSNILDQLSQILYGAKVELIDIEKTLSNCDGREILRTEYEGSITVRFNVKIENMQELGYNE